MSLVSHLHIGRSNEKFVLLKCADHASDDGSGIYPGRELLAASTELSISTVQRILRKFVENGVLIVISEGGGRNRATVYEMNIDRLLGLYNWIEVDGEEKLPPFLLKQGATISGAKPGHGNPVYEKETGSTTTETGLATTNTGSELDPLTFNNRHKPFSASETTTAPPPRRPRAAAATRPESLLAMCIGDRTSSAFAISSATANSTHG
jgi:hypothetical protein